VRTTHDIVCTHCGRVLETGPRSCPVDGAPTKRRARAPVGAVLAGRYRLDKVLGRGGWATVYQVRDLQRGEDAALKLLSPELRKQAAAVRRFIDEAQTLVRLNHPHVVTVWECGQSDRYVFIVMELLKGLSLADEIVTQAPLETERAVRIALQILEGLAAAHDRGLVHRDLKPDNVLMVDTGRETFAKVADFGIARSVIQDNAQRPGGIVGTAAYMSPEQARGGEVDARSDIFSLGLVLYEMLTGEPAYPVEAPLLTLQRRVQEPPREIHLAFPDLTLPDGLAQAVNKLVAHSPQDRPQDAREAMRLLAPFGGTAGAVRTVRRDDFIYAPLNLCPPLTGRDEEIALLTPLVERVGEFPHATLLIIAGPGGVGKTRLASRLADIACEKRGAHRYDKACSGRGPLREMSEVLEDLLGTRELDAAVLQQRLCDTLGDERRAADLRRLMRPEEDDGPSSQWASEGDERDYRCQIVLDTLARLAAYRPLVLVLEDVHGADSLTRTVIERLPLWSHDRGKGLLFIVTWTTDGEGSGAPPAIQSPRVADRARLIRLAPLSERAADELLRAMGPLDGRARALIARLAAGNPLHIVQLVRHMKTEKLLLPSRRGWRLAPSTRYQLTVPYAVGVLGTQHVQQLRAREGSGQKAADLLERLALLGERASMPVLRDVLEREARTDLLEDVEVLVDLLAVEDLVRREGDSIIFAHRLVREAIAAGLTGRPESASTHIGIAETLAARLGNDPHLASAAALHFFHGGAAKRALPLALRSAALSRSLGDMERAADEYALAARILAAQKRPPRATRLEIELGLGFTALERGDTRKAEDHFLRALGLSDCAAAHEGLGRTAEAKAACTAALDHLSQAERLYQAEGNAGRAAEVSIVLNRTCRQLGDFQGARRHAQKAQTLFEGLGDQVGAAVARKWQASLEVWAGGYARGLELAEAARPVLEATGNPLLIGECLNCMASLHAEMGHHQTAIDLNAQARSHFERAGKIRGLVNTMGSIGTAQTWLGNHDEAHRLLEAALRLAEDAEIQGLVIYALVNLGWSCRLAGRLEESAQWLRSGIAQIQSSENLVSLSYAYLELGLTLVERGELDEAETCFRRVLESPSLRPDVRRDCLEGLEKIARLCRDRGEVKTPKKPN